MGAKSLGVGKGMPGREEWFTLCLVNTSSLSATRSEIEEHTLYQIGFLVTGLLLASSVRLWSAVFAPLLTAAGFDQ